MGGERKGHFDVRLAYQSSSRLRSRDNTQRCPDKFGQSGVELRQTPDRRALKYRELLDVGRDRRDDLECRRAATDDQNLVVGDVPVSVTLVCAGVVTHTSRSSG